MLKKFIRSTDQFKHMPPRLYKIWSIEHQMWWKPLESGYTPTRSEAGAYSFEAATVIVKRANIHDMDIPNEAMIELSKEEYEIIRNT